MPAQESIVFAVKDYRGNRVVFTRQKLKQKKIDHPELNLFQFISAVKKALQEPEEVWPDYFDRKRRCYYGKYEDGVYTKVVVHMSYHSHEPSRVVSAYAVAYIKERKYKNLTRIA